jgi:signal transduction histidine kinase
MPKDVQLAVYCDPSVPLQLQTDPGLVRQILLNLIGNAIKFTDDGAVRVHLGLSPDADALRIEVIDTGIGIAEDKQSGLFNGICAGRRRRQSQIRRQRLGAGHQPSSGALARW